MISQFCRLEVALGYSPGVGRAVFPSGGHREESSLPPPVLGDAFIPRLAAPSSVCGASTDGSQCRVSQFYSHTCSACRVWAAQHEGPN